MPENFARLVFSQSCSCVLLGRVLQVGDHLVDVVLELQHFALRFDVDRPGQVALRHGGGDVGDRADLGGQVAGELVHVVGQILPRSGGARHLGLAAEFSFDTDFAGHRRHLVGESAQRVGHAVDRFGESGDFAFRFENELLVQDRRWRPRSRPSRYRAPAW